MPRFTLKELLIASTLVCLGAGSMAVGQSHILRYYGDGVYGELPRQIAVDMLLWYGGCAVIGAGVFLPFKRPFIGASVAFIVLLVFYIVAFGIGMSKFR